MSLPLSDLESQMRERLRELEPLVLEADQLKRVLKALDDAVAPPSSPPRDGAAGAGRREVRPGAAQTKRCVWSTSDQALRSESSPALGDRKYVPLPRDARPRSRRQGPQGRHRLRTRRARRRGEQGKPQSAPAQGNGGRNRKCREVPNVADRRATARSQATARVGVSPRPPRRAVKTGLRAPARGTLIIANRSHESARSLTAISHPRRERARHPRPALNDCWADS